MRTPILFLCSCLALLPAAGAANTGEGVLTADGSEAALKAVAVEPGFGDTALLITEQPLPEGCTVFDAYTLASAGKLRGLAVTISQETKGIERAGLNALYHESWEGMLTNIGEPEVGIEQYDDETLKGRVSLSDGSFIGHSFSYDVRFEVALKRERPVLDATVTGGENSTAAQAYAAYYRAMMAGRLEEGKQHVIEEQAAQIAGEDVEFFLDMFQSNPLELTITSADEKGKTATLTAEGVVAGCMEDGQAKGTIEMVQEGGAWKVKSESWEM